MKTVAIGVDYGGGKAFAERFFGELEGLRMYRRRDLLLEWRQRYLREAGAGIPDLDDERGHFSVRE